MGKAGEMPPTARRISSIFMIIIFVMLILSAAALYQVVEAYRTAKQLDVASIVLSLSAITISLYMLLQLKMKPLKLGFEPQKVLTKIECQKCGYTNLRDFQQGDFIFKVVEPCPKCNEEMAISSIYRKREEKGKGKR